MAAMYGVYHGPDGLKAIAQRCHAMAAVVAEGARKAGHKVGDAPFFDTVCIDVGDSAAVVSRAAAEGINLRALNGTHVTVAVDETTTLEDLDALLCVLCGAISPLAAELAEAVDAEMPGDLARTSAFMTNSVFHKYHSEHDMLRCAPALRALCSLHFYVDCSSCSRMVGIPFVLGGLLVHGSMRPLFSAVRLVEMRPGALANAW